MWKLNKTTEKWEFSRLDFPEDAVGGKASDVSADGSIIVGTVWYKSYEVAAYWQNGECHLIEGIGEDVQYNEGYNQNSAKQSALMVNILHSSLITRFRLSTISKTGLTRK